MIIKNILNNFFTIEKSKYTSNQFNSKFFM